MADITAAQLLAASEAAPMRLVNASGTAFVDQNADGGLQVHVMNPGVATTTANVYGTNQTPIFKRGVISTGSTTDVLLASATGVPAGYAANTGNVDYAATALKTFYLTDFWGELDNPPGGQSVVVTLELNGVKCLFISLTDILRYQKKEYRGIRVLAGQTVKLYVRNPSAGPVIVACGFAGVEE